MYGEADFQTCRENTILWTGRLNHSKDLNLLARMADDDLFIRAADNSPNLLPLLRSNPQLASSQDEHGYSLLHAAASYNHVDLLRTLVNEFHLDVNVKDEDGETPLFVAETVQVAQVLAEELGADITIKNEEGLTAEEKFRADGDSPTVADFLRECRLQKGAPEGQDAEANGDQPCDALFNNRLDLPSLPPNVSVKIDVTDEESAALGVDVDPEFKQRIEELAARDDFQGAEGQRQLKDLITDAVRSTGQTSHTRDVKKRVG